MRCGWMHTRGAWVPGFAGSVTREGGLVAAAACGVLVAEAGPAGAGATMALKPDVALTRLGPAAFTAVSWARILHPTSAAHSV